MKRIAIFLAVAALAGSCVSVTAMDAHHADARSPRNRVVIQVSDAEPARWSLALNNAKNLQSDLGTDNVQIEIVAYGPGLAMLKTGSSVAPRIDESVLSGMTISACENTMANQKVTRDQILPGVTFVPAGVVEIMRKQQQGWTYLRP
jgi:intracellular sulfur oxidation DsrE/DsrF family protein